MAVERPVLGDVCRGVDRRFILQREVAPVGWMMFLSS